MPLVFQEIDPESASLTEAQAAVIDSLREEFVASIGGGQQNPYDPGYAKRWQVAQPANDDELRRFFGSSFADLVALQAAQEETAAKFARRAR